MATTRSKCPDGGVYSSRSTCCHATVIPNQLALSFASEAYDDMDRLKHPADVEALAALVRQLVEFSQRMM